MENGNPFIEYFKPLGFQELILEVKKRIDTSLNIGDIE